MRDTKTRAGWSGDPSGRLALQWSEMDGPTVRPPKRTGLGSALIHHVLTEDDGRVEVKFAPTGLSCSVSFMNN
jgi:two-component sensor histidine kinase